MYSIYEGDCLEVMRSVPDGSVDIVFADLPYGTTYAKWDSVIPMNRLWEQYERICKKDAALVFTAVQPFTSALVSSKPEWFRVEWIWDKVNGANFGNSKRMPMKTHESVLVFGKNPPVYFPQMTKGRPNNVQGQRARTRTAKTQKIDPSVAKDILSGLKYPKTVQTISKHSSQCGYHPTQKPTELMEYFLKTYSRFGDTVLDNSMGSGSTGVACANIGRVFIGIEKDRNYFKIAEQRIHEAYSENDWIHLV